METARRDWHWKTAAYLLLTFSIGLPAILPEVANVAFLVLSAVGLFFLFQQNQLRLLLHPAAALPLTGAALVLAALSFTATDSSGFIPALALTPVCLVGPAASLFVLGGIRIEGVAITALAGTFVAAVLAAIETILIGSDRAGFLVGNPIHFAAVAIALGFLALIGLESTKPWLRRAVLAGPVLAVFAVWLSASRGPLLALPPMAVTVVVALCFLRLPRRQAVLAALATILVCAASVIWAWHSPYIQQVPALRDVISYLRDGVVADHSIATRILMYESGIQAWLTSPWFGQGADFFARAVALVPEGASYPPYDHLHSDWIDFAAMAGCMGLTAYLLILAAMPAVAILNGPHRPAAVLVGMPICVGYAVMGLTNALIGVLTQTVVLSAILAILAALTVKPEANSP
jgi:O-antigen ligase